MKVAAAPRDASWLAHPNVYSFKVVHASNGDDFARCMPVPLCESPGWSDLREVPHNVRCRRRACAKAFADAETGSTAQDHLNGAGAVGSGVQQAGTASDRPAVAADEGTDSPSSPPRPTTHTNRRTSDA